MDRLDEDAKVEDEQIVGAGDGGDSEEGGRSLATLVSARFLECIPGTLHGNPLDSIDYWSYLLLGLSVKLTTICSDTTLTIRFLNQNTLDMCSENVLNIAGSQASWRL
nr:hypothetical protein CFP56_38775 [Quercus suber]